MKYDIKEMELSQVIDEACDRLAELGDEMQEAFDNTPEGLQNSAVGEARQEAADQFASLDKPSVHESIESTKIKVGVPVRSPSETKRLSRAARRDDAVTMLQDALGALEDMPEPRYAHVDELIEELGQLIGEAEAIEFPGRTA